MGILAIASGVLGLVCAVIAGRPAALRPERGRPGLEFDLSRRNDGRRLDGWL
jgi:hypothetical protein